MAFNVSKEIAKTLIVFLPSMGAFIFAFNMLFQADPVFYGLYSTSVKILVMMQGEFEFDENFSSQKVKEEGGRNHSIQVMLKHSVSKNKCVLCTYPIIASICGSQKGSFLRKGY